MRLSGGSGCLEKDPGSKKQDPKKLQRPTPKITFLNHFDETEFKWISLKGKFLFDPRRSIHIHDLQLDLRGFPHPVDGDEAHVGVVKSRPIPETVGSGRAAFVRDGHSARRQV